MSSRTGKDSNSSIDSGAIRNATASDAKSTSDTTPELSELYRLSNSYKHGSFARVLTKCVLAGAVGLVIGPIASRGPFLNTAIISAVNAAMVIGFYDIVREAATATTVCDTPFISGAAGALTGYVWNGLVHQSKSRAVAGALVVGGLATTLHVAMPRFDAYKTSLGTLLDFDLISDPDAKLKTTAEAPPVLRPFSTQAASEYLGTLALQLLPVKEVSPEEYEKLQLKDPLKIGFRGPLPLEEVPVTAQTRSSDRSEQE